MNTNLSRNEVRILAIKNKKWSKQINISKYKLTL